MDAETSSDEGQNRHYASVIDDADRQTLTRIATTMSHRQSHRTNSIGGLDWNDAEMDPENKGFNLHKWLQIFMRDLDHENIKSKRAGILFKSLAVSGSGAALQTQQTVATSALAPIDMAKSLFSGKTDHKQILHHFDGVLKSGELLIVLGRPGSGCSTMLKSLCGETHGLTVDEKSLIHYNGKLLIFQ